jgi:cell volume regulation protein A
VYESVPIRTVDRIAVVALAVILFNGGIDIGWRRFRASAALILSLGVLGTSGQLDWSRWSATTRWVSTGSWREAGVNDPAGIALILGTIELATHADASFWVVVREFAVEMSIGVAVGLLGALVLIPVLRVLRLPSEGL